MYTRDKGSSERIIAVVRLHYFCVVLASAFNKLSCTVTFPQDASDWTPLAFIFVTFTVMAYSVMITNNVGSQ